MKNFNIDQFISSVPVLRLFGKNLALNAGIAFVIQAFNPPIFRLYFQYSHWLRCFWHNCYGLLVFNL